LYKLITIAMNISKLHYVYSNSQFTLLPTSIMLKVWSNTSLRSFRARRTWILIKQSQPEKMNYSALIKNN